MKKLILAILIIFAVYQPINAEETDHVELYNQTSKVDFSFVHGIDPWQDEDYFKYAWSPYPSFRSSLDLYFKDIQIPAGYYLLTPREYKERNVILFKEAGKVKFIIPVVTKELVPIGYYETNVPKPKKTKWECFAKGFSDFWYKIFKSSKRVPPPESFIRARLTEDRYVIINVYYGAYMYTLIFNTEAYNN